LSETDVPWFDLVVKPRQCGNELASVPDPDILALQQVATSVLATELWPDFVIGEEVQIQGGPLVGLIGRLLEIEKSMRLVLSVDLLNRSILVEIEPDWVRPLGLRKGPTLT
jgi:transcription antitermination factor NusG